MPSRPRSREFEEKAKRFGDKVKAVREARDLTQEELAHLAGISRNQVQNIESNRNNSKDSSGRPGPANAKLDMVYGLASALRVDVNYLVDYHVDVEPVPVPIPE